MVLDGRLRRAPKEGDAGIKAANDEVVQLKGFSYTSDERGRVSRYKGSDIVQSCDRGEFES